MPINKTKKLLVVHGMECSMEQLIEQIPYMNQANTIIIQSYGSVILPFGDIMRDIITVVYQEYVDEIFVAYPNAIQKNSRPMSGKIYENTELQEKIKTLEYLFKNCSPEFSHTNLKDWLEGEKMAGKQNSADIISRHPLMPTSVKITEIPIEQGNSVFC